MRILVVGAGYVGLVTAAGLADFGHHVVCVDIDVEKISQLCAGKMPIYEPGLADLIRRNRDAGRLHFLPDHGDYPAELVFLCVGTPSNPDGSAYLSDLFSAARSVAVSIEETTLVIKSTVPVGTAAKVREIVSFNPLIKVASNPEFLKEGDAVRDFLAPDRVVIGTKDGGAKNRLLELYSAIVRSNGIILTMSNESAELCKYASNAMLATRISFMNELANLSEKVGADIDDVRKAVGADSRIGPRFLFPGLGYGGSCFGKDVRALLHVAEEHGEKMNVVRATHVANVRQKRILLDKIRGHFGRLSDLTVAVWGLSFKPETSDRRDAPANEIIDALSREGSMVVGWDPVCAPEGSMYEAVHEANALVLCTEWRAFRRPDWKLVKHLMRTPVVFDGRNIWDPEELRSLGFTYYGIGRG